MSSARTLLVEAVFLRFIVIIDCYNNMKFIKQRNLLLIVVYRTMELISIL